MQKLLLLCIQLCLFQYLFAADFTIDLSLQDLKKYAEQFPEEVQPDNVDPWNKNLDAEFSPIYEKFLKETEVSIFKKILARLGIGKHIMTDYELLKKLLAQVIQERELQGFFGDHVVLLGAQPTDHIVVWGDLQGGFHSLIRDLEELKHLGIIDENLIIKPGHYFIFDGNVIGRTPYNIEVLTVVAALMHKNPEKVFYIRSWEEEKGFWTKRTLFAELYDEGESSFADRNSLASLMDRFIQTLPLSLYINYNKGSDLIRISGYGRDFLRINERLMDKFFSTESQELITIYPIKHKIPSKDDVHVRVFLRNMGGDIEFVKNDGLVLLDPYGGAMVWAAFSSPTRFHGKINDFYKDAFVIIALAQQLRDVTITLYNRDTRINAPFAPRSTYNLLSGELVSKDHDEEQPVFTVGSTMDLTKGVSGIGKMVRQGIMVSIDEHRKLRLGKNLKVIILDDAYTPYKSRENVNYFMNKEHINTLLLPVGSPTLQTSMDLLESHSLLMLFPVTGGLQLRDKALSNVINLRSSYHDEVYAMIPYLIQKYLVKDFAFFYQDDVYGTGPMEAARAILKAYGIKNWTEIPYNRSITDFKDVVEKINKAKPEALGLFSTASITQQMLRELGISSLSSTYIFGISFLVDDAFKRFVEELGFKYLFARSVPNPRTSDLSIVRDYQRAMDKVGLIPNPYSLEAYIGTNLLLEAINKIQPPLNNDSIRSFFESMKDYSFKGLNLTFDPKTRDLNHDVWLDTGSDNWIKVSSPELLFKKARRKKELSTILGKALPYYEETGVEEVLP